ncbi:hypothetical protein B0H12DRAFT_1245409 [Mycena haematopus]|nr:hypothetical protein B0H12DRAFT_1245409 [Mycena haematopus]
MDSFEPAQPGATRRLQDPADDSDQNPLEEEYVDNPSNLKLSPETEECGGGEALDDADMDAAAPGGYYVVTIAEIDPKATNISAYVSYWCLPVSKSQSPPTAPLAPQALHVTSRYTPVRSPARRGAVAAPHARNLATLCCPCGDRIILASACLGTDFLHDLRRRSNYVCAIATAVDSPFYPAHRTTCGPLLRPSFHPPVLYKFRGLPRVARTDG